MKFDEALLRFARALQAEYGLDPRDLLVRISLHPKLFDRVIIEDALHRMMYKPSDCNHREMFGIIIDARTKDQLI
jgi:hypothetical protein